MNTPPHSRPDPLDIDLSVPAQGWEGSVSPDEPASETAPRVLDLPVVFTGSGSEYFRIWAVNLLLTLVTFSFYYPFAKVRRLRYFYGNTMVGDHPLAFHGNPWAMLRGYVLMAVLFGLYSVAGAFSVATGVIAALILMAVFPLLFWSGQRFRLANTSWRGLRMAFTGDKAGAYSALALLAVPLVMFTAVGYATESADNSPSHHALASGLASLVVLVSLALWPFAFARIKRYQHANLRFGAQRSRFTATMGQFYNVSVKAGGVALLAALVSGAVTGLLGFVLAGQMGALAGAGFGGYLGAIVASQGWYQAGLQNLVWPATSSPLLSFSSRLSGWQLSGLHLKNWLLVVLTLGLYWPFAKVAVARLRLQAVTVHMDSRVERDAAQPGDRPPEAAGDAAGDVFGVDFGL